MAPKLKSKLYIIHVPCIHQQLPTIIPTQFKQFNKFDTFDSSLFLIFPILVLVTGDPHTDPPQVESPAACRRISYWRHISRAMRRCESPDAEDLPKIYKDSRGWRNCSHLESWYLPCCWTGTADVDCIAVRRSAQRSGLVGDFDIGHGKRWSPAPPVGHKWTLQRLRKRMAT